MSKFADEKVEEFVKKLYDSLPDCHWCGDADNIAKKKVISDFTVSIRKTIAEAEKRGKIKAYIDMLEEFGCSIFNEIEGREYCENKIKQLETDND